MQPQQAFSQGENGECIDTRPACRLARSPKPPFPMRGRCLGRASLRPAVPYIIMPCSGEKLFLLKDYQLDEDTVAICHRKYDNIKTQPLVWCFFAQMRYN